MCEKNGLDIISSTTDLYGAEDKTGIAPADLEALTSIRTYYEQMWLDRGIPIKYVKFALPKEGALEEPNVEIPVDGYRSYNHEVVSTRKTGR